MEKIGDDSAIIFTINGKVYSANKSNVKPDTSLNTFIRDQPNLKGTKYMCKEGGCGSCEVAIQSTHPVTKKTQTYGVFSCLMPVLSCHGKSITTIEGIGNRRSGYNKIQEYLAKFNGTQCGYCSPAMVMNMYSLLKQNPNITMREVEDSFGGNICRCTGYRPILDAFKALASDASEDLKRRAEDIEDLIKSCKLPSTGCANKCTNCTPKALCKNSELDKNYLKTETAEDDVADFIEFALSPLKLQLRLASNSLWFRVTTVKEIFEVFDATPGKTYMLVCGNTAQGVLGVYRKVEPPQVFIDISNVAELKEATIRADSLELGANMTLTDTINFFKLVSRQNPLLFGYTSVLVDHMELVANIPVRNVGSLAGNLMTKHDNLYFDSDIFLIFLTVGARLVIRDRTGISETVTLLQYLKMNMNYKLITKVILPTISSNHYYLRTYKVMPRAQNVHATVNAGFLFRINRIKDNLIEEKPVIVYGNITDTFTRAYQTETYLSGKHLLKQETLTNALKILSEEVNPQNYPTKASIEYRKKLAMALFYRYVLSVNPDMVNSRYRSGSNNLHRPLSSGKQEIVTNKEMWPVTQPVLKLEALLQTSGEAEYVNDMPILPDELYGALVIADKACAVISNIDASTALNIPGVVAFYTAKDIPGTNTFIQPAVGYQTQLENEELFSSGKTLYAGQPVGVIIATSQDLAIRATNYVTITYSSSSKPLLTVDDVLQSGEQSRIISLQNMAPTASKSDIKHVIKSEYKLEGQYHFTMELQTCLCVPTDIGMSVYSSTQWTGGVQNAISLVLDMDANKVNVKTKRVGGAYGVKVSRSNMVASACALATHKLEKPVRMVLNLETNMRAIGKRNPLLANYEVAVNDSGEIQYLKLDFYENYGDSLNDNVALFAISGIPSFYDTSTWAVNIYAVKTDNACSAWMRAPGTFEAVCTIEHIMEHIAFVTKKDPLAVRQINSISTDKNNLNELIQTLMKSADYSSRLDQVVQFNKTNRWRKKGLTLQPIKYSLEFLPNYYSLVSIYATDGTVAVTTSGIEMGQGLNTKIAQVTAHELGVDLSKVQIIPNMVITSPNSFATGGSTGTDCNGYATIRCCQQINERLKPLREQMGGSPPWIDLVQAAVKQGVSLSAQYMYSMSDPIPQNYDVYGSIVLEVEVDLLTGQYQMPRVDIIQDAGQSLSPLIDIGQIEGAFVMGLGYFHSEHLVYDQNNGRLLTDRTWTYWVPGFKDIPIDWRISLRKNSLNPKGIFSSKAVSEPPICLSLSQQHALRMAIKNAREEDGKSTEWDQIQISNIKF